MGFFLGFRGVFSGNKGNIGGKVRDREVIGE